MEKQCGNTKNKTLAIRTCPKAFFDIEIDGEKAGRVVMKLRKDVVPKTVETSRTETVRVGSRSTARSSRMRTSSSPTLARACSPWRTLGPARTDRSSSSARRRLRGSTASTSSSGRSLRAWILLRRWRRREARRGKRKRKW